MKRVTMADFPGAPLIVVGDEAMTAEEFAAYRKKQERQNASRRERRATDPEYRERYNAYHRDYQRRRAT